jgi:hypothetical protein
VFLAAAILVADPGKRGRGVVHANSDAGENFDGYTNN